jgi:LuxR family maltose regulon positive regulatory protein
MTIARQVPGPRLDGAKSFRPPPQARNVVERRRLLEGLDRSLDAPLTLVSAPAGFGKTTLLLSWLAARDDFATAWLCPDDVTEGRQFWPTAYQALSASAGLDPPDGFDDAPPAEALRRLAEESARPLVLVVDDFHEIRSAAVLASLDRLLARGEPDVHVVLACRRDPGLGLHRLRLTGRLAEIRAGELAFTIDEAVEFFALADLPLRPELVGALLARTEGWAAALRFAAISLAHESEAETFVLAVSRTEQAVSDYLVSEVLAAQPRRIRDFLLRTSICDRIDGQLADDLTGRTDGAGTLAELDRDNVFIDLGGDGRWYRYHGLFGELLRAEAARKLGEELPELHRRAAERLALEGDRFAALRHALAGGDAVAAADLVGELWIELDGRGDEQLADLVLERLDQAAVRRHPQLCLLAAWQALRRGDETDADAWLKLAETGGRKLRAADRPAFDLGRALVDLRRKQLRGDLSAASRAVKRLARPAVLPGSAGLAGDGRRALLLVARGVESTWDGRIDEALPALEAGLDVARRTGLPAAEAEAAATLALACAFRGDLKRAAHLARPVVAAAEETRRPAPRHTVPALLALARCNLEWDDAEEARALAERARGIAEERGDRLGRAGARALSAQAAAGASPGLDVVRAELAALDLEDDTHLPPLLEPSVDVLRSRLARAGDDPTAGLAILAAGEGTEHAVEAARVALSLDDAAGACELLDLVIEQASGPKTTLVEAYVLRAIAADRDTRDGDGRTWLEQALELAEPDAIRRPFAEAGPELTPLLREAIRHGTAHRWLAGSLLAVRDGRDSAAGHAARELLDPLSERETIVLRYLPTMLSNQEIAGELFVSVNTVKTHLKSIYRKLGVSDRREAVRLARELRLVG